MNPSYFTFSKEHVALLVVDVQDKLFTSVERASEVLYTILKVVRGFQILNLPIFISEQYPQGLGQTVEPLRLTLGEQYKPWHKTSFSCLGEASIADYIASSPYQQWVIIGLEAHICVLQTAQGLLKLGKQVATLNDAITSRSIFDFSTAIAEMRDAGVRITSTETLLFELLATSQAPEFKPLSQLVKACCNCQ